MITNPKSIGPRLIHPPLIRTLRNGNRAHRGRASPPDSAPKPAGSLGRDCPPLARSSCAPSASRAPRLRALAAVGELPPDPGLGAGEVGVAARVARLVPRRRAGRRRAGALPPAARGQALPRLPPRGPGHRLGVRPARRLARPDGRAPEEAGGVRRPDGSAGRHPPLERRAGQGGHRRSRRTPPRRGRAHRAERRRRPRGLPAPRARLAAAGRPRAASPPASRSTTSRSRSPAAPRTTSSRA